MTKNDFTVLPNNHSRDKDRPSKLTYWRSAYNCFSIEYKGAITELCEGDLGYGDMDRLDGAIHAAIECKRKTREKCRLENI